MKRYRMDECGGMEPADDGEWVKYEEAKDRFDAVMVEKEAAQAAEDAHRREMDIVRLK